jgi:hypothetical protein
MLQVYEMMGGDRLKNTDDRTSADRVSLVLPVPISMTRVGHDIPSSQM